jgi:hypothetical protein
MYAVVWVRDHAATGATSTAQAVKIDDYFEHEITADGTLTIHCLDIDFPPAPGPNGRFATLDLTRGRPSSFAPGGWELFELFGADGTRFKTKRPRPN